MKTRHRRSVIAGAVLALGASSSAQANDDCANAILIPYANDGQPGWGDPGGRLTLGSTVGAIAEGTVISCQGAPNIGPGVWFKIIGAGNLTRISTDHPSTEMDTKISVYCSADDSCDQLACVVGNDDIDEFGANWSSRVEFCGAIGREYYILVHGGTAGVTGEFGLVVEEPTDGQGLKSPCFAAANCEPACSFEVPAGAVSEHEPLPEGPSAYLQSDTACDDTVKDNAASGTNGGCSVPGGSQRKFTPLTIGVAMKGDSHACNGSQDSDWFVLEDQLPVQEAFIIDYTFQSEGPMECIPWFASPDYSRCAVLAYPTMALRTDTCTVPVTWRTVMDSKGIGLDGQPNDDLLFRVRNRASSGYDCASGLNDYWLRINWVLPASECPPVPDPPGVVGIDFDDERDEATSNTFDGTGGKNGFQYEPCHCNTPDDGLHRGKRGCEYWNQSDGDFLRLVPGRPMIGAMSYARNSSGVRDTDWYKFELTERSLVRMNVECGGPLAFAVQENTCEADAVIYATAATLGHCGPDHKDIEGQVVLDSGVYIVVGALRNAFLDFTTAPIYAWVDCDPVSNSYGLAKYRLDLTATPAPPCCAGNADQLSGLVNFDDIVAVLANWDADYGRGATGPGDATCGAGDGVVNFEDINAVLANWLTACP